MNRTFQIIELGIISSILGLFFEYFGAIHLVYIVLLLVIFVDTFTGIAVAIRHKRFSLKGINKLVKKIVTYSIAVFTIRLLEIAILSLVTTTALSQIMGIFLILNETISVLENLTLLGVPLPPNFIGVLLGHIKIPGLEMKKPAKVSSRVDEIQDIIDYQLVTVENECVRSLLGIYFEVWKHAVIQLKGYLRKNTNSDSDLIYFKVLNLVQLTLQNVQEKWEKSNVTKECIEKFIDAQECKMKHWLQKVKATCYLNYPADKKEDQIIDSIIVLLYQTIIDARKSFYDEEGKSCTIPDQ